MRSRRDFITLLGGAAAWPLDARAASRASAARGYSHAVRRERRRDPKRIATFRLELRKLGWTEGAHLRIDERWSGDDMDRARHDAAELINLNPDVVVVAGRRHVRGVPLKNAPQRRMTS
jgi:putative ABC transport system substrate-binding protein